MSDPRLPDPSPGLSSLYEAARDDPGLAPAALERVVHRAAKPRSWIGPTVGVLSLVALTGWLALRAAAPSSPNVGPLQPGSPPSPPEIAAPAAPPPEELAPIPTPSVEPTPALPAAPSPRRAHEPVPTTAHESTPAEADPSEGALLLRARAALPRDAAACLSLTDRHRELYPHGTMEEEREVLAIEALAALGRPSTEDRASRFSRSFPRSPYAARVRTALERVRGSP